MTTLTAGTALGHYTIEGVLGEGAMAVVYRARHRTLRTEHAIKIPRYRHRALTARAMREGRLQASLRHPNIVAVTDLLDADGAPALVMELISGLSLEDHILQGRLRPEQKDPFARAILSAVAYAHDRGLIHRDLKPSNVLLEEVGAALVPRVADFGLAKDLEDDAEDGSATRPNTPMGTPMYMAPEQILDARAADARADVFSLGALLYELVTGKKAFNGRDLSAIYDEVSQRRYAPLPDDVPGPWRLAITRALSPERDDRPATAGELLSVWTAGEPAGHPAPLPIGRPSATPSRPARTPSSRPSRSVPRASTGMSGPSRSGELPAMPRPRRAWSSPDWSSRSMNAVAFLLGMFMVACVVAPFVGCLVGVGLAAPRGAIAEVPPVVSSPPAVSSSPAVVLVSGAPAWAVAGTQRFELPASLPAGDYQLRARWDDGEAPAGTLRVVPGDLRRIACDPATRTCR